MAKRKSRDSGDPPGASENQLARIVEILEDEKNKRSFNNFLADEMRLHLVGCGEIGIDMEAMTANIKSDINLKILRRLAFRGLKRSPNE